MPIFKYPISRLRRRQVKAFSSYSLSAGTEPIHEYLDHLLSTNSDPSLTQKHKSEFFAFLSVYNRYIDQKAGKQLVDWSKVHPPADQQIIAHSSLPQAHNVPMNKLVVLKVNGGLGTSMGLNGAKSALEVRQELTFLDLLSSKLSNLTRTEDDTLKILQRYKTRPVKITTINQSRHPRLLKETLLPYAKSMHDGKAAWNPSGHGDLYDALHRSGTLRRLLSEGKEFLFVSNSDNLGAIVDERILAYMAETQSEFIMEVTNKTKSDLTGGTLIALERIMDQKSMSLDIIARTKDLDDGCSIIQLETAAGSAIKHFKKACGINVSRGRFLPVKNCADLLLVRSSLFEIERGSLIMNSKRMFGSIPIIKLDSHFQTINQFQKRFKQIPDILELDHLTVSGDVCFGRNVILRGTMIIIANAGQRIDIPDGVILENRLVSGSVRMIEL
ncbi:UTP-glucose-1-phosphate uridylyltransferase [Panaeolus papilionaceus]|nr:UTP-glucose-1-phosphate uridylyltransferase [Panaeolus papilionaceus]